MKQACWEPLNPSTLLVSSRQFPCLPHVAYNRVDNRKVIYDNNGKNKRKSCRFTQQLLGMVWLYSTGRLWTHGDWW